MRCATFSVLLALGWLISSPTGLYAQAVGPAGTVNFSNSPAAVGGNGAPIFDVDGVTRLSGTNALAQLWAALTPVESAMLPVSNPVPFRTGAAAGFVSTVPNSVCNIPFVAAGITAYFQVRVWDARCGNSFAEAEAALCPVGRSKIFAVRTGGGGTPPEVPANLVGLESFSLSFPAAPPWITVQPVGTIVFDGDPVHLSVGVAGQEPLSYQWQINGVSLPGGFSSATNAELVLTNANPSQAGGYAVIVTNPYGSVTSVTAQVVVKALPAGALVQFSNRDPSTGLNAPVYDDTASVPARLLSDTNCVAQLYAGPSADNLLPVGEPAPFLTGPDAGYWAASIDSWRAIPGVVPGDTAFARVLVWDITVGSTYEQARAAGGKVGRSEVFAVMTGGMGAPVWHPAPLAGLRGLHVKHKPVITLQPTSKVIALHATATFSVGVDQGVVTYQWRLNGADIPGATNALLRVTGMESSVVGDYTVLVSNEAGATLSATATLRVETPTWGGTVNFHNRVIGSDIDAPVFDVDGGTRLAGSAFVAQLYAGPTATNLQAATLPVPFRTGDGAGYFDPGPDSGVVLPNVGPGAMAYLQVRVWEIAAGTTFEVAMANGGKFGVSETITVITGGWGEPPGLPTDMAGLKSFKLEQLPLILNQPLGGEYFVGETVVLEVTVSSLTTVTYQWAQNGQSLPAASLARLTLTASLDSTGGYYVDVRNASGTTRSATAQIVVRPVPNGPTVQFSNRLPRAGLDAPVFDLDGTNRVSGTNFVAQLFGGVTPGTLVPLGDPVPFLSGDDAGYWQSSIDAWRAIPGINPGDTAFVQVRVWERSKGAAYEEALQAGGKVGESDVLEITTGGTGAPPALPTVLTALKSFHLRRIPLITRQPVSRNVFIYKAVAFEVSVESAEAFYYQWRFNGSALPGETNRVLRVSRVLETDAGKYSVLVSNSLGSVLSSEATLEVTLQTSGGLVNFDNRVPAAGLDAPVFDLDGVTRLAGPACFAQLYGGPTLTNLIPVSLPAGFYSGTNAGYWFSGLEPVVTLTNVGPGLTAYLQVRVWEAAAGVSYEIAATNGGRFGASEAFAVVTGGEGDPPSPPANLVGLKSFHVEQVPVFTRQPLGGGFYAGDTVVLETVVSSASPVSLQWEANGAAVPGATGSTLILTNIRFWEGGVFGVLASNQTGWAVSAKAFVEVEAALLYGATIHFANRAPLAGLDAPILAADGMTRLSGARFVAQLHAGVAADQLQPLGAAAPFGVGTEAGYWIERTNYWRRVPGASGGATVYAQVWIWEQEKGALFEQALNAGGQVGKSEVLQVVTGGGGGTPPTPPAALIGLKSFRLTSLPVIVTQPSSLVALVGRPFSLLVGVTSAEPISYQWRREGTNLVGANMTALTVTNTDFNAAGAYDVLVSTSVGSVTSRVATVTVENSPVFGGGTVNFSNSTNALGESSPVYDVDGTNRVAGSTFLAQLYGGPSPDILFPMDEPLTFRTGAGAGFLNTSTGSGREVPGVAPGGMAYLQMRVWDSTSGATFELAVAAGGKFGFSNTIRIRTGGDGSPPSLPANMVGLESFSLQQVPVFRRQPLSSFAYAGGTVTLGVEVQSASPVTFQWQRDGTVIPGATAATLTLTNLQTAQAGAYRVTANNLTGASSSSSATLFVQAIPAGATVHFSNRELAANLDAPVYDSDGVTPLAGNAYLAQLYAGTNGDSLFPIGTPIPFLSGADAGYWDKAFPIGLTLPGITPGDQAVVQVRVWEAARGPDYETAIGSHGKVGVSDLLRITTGGGGTPPALPALLTGLKSFRVDRLPTPFIQFQPMDQLVVLGGTASFEVTVTNAASVGYQWQREIGTNQWQNLAGGNSAVYSIANVTAADAGAFRVVVTNNAGPTVSDVARLIISPELWIGETNGQFKLVAQAGAGPAYQIEVSSNLVNWAPLLDVTNATRILRFEDPNATNAPARFYRARNLSSGQLVSEGTAGSFILTVPPGFSMLATPLLTANQSVEDVFAGMPEGTFVYQYYPATGRYSINTFEFGAWGLKNQPLHPGDGAFVFNQTENTYRLVVKGVVPQGALSHPVPHGWAMYSALYPQTGSLDGALGFPLSNLDIVARFDSSQGIFLVYVYTSAGWLGGEAPQIGLGESFWVYRNTATTWRLTAPTGN